MKSILKNPFNHVIIISFILGIIVCHKLFHPELKDEVITTTETSTKTTIETVDEEFGERATQTKPIVAKRVFPKNEAKDPEPEKYDSIRQYSGTYSFDYGKFDWEIETGGLLTSYNFKPTLLIPTTETTTNTSTVKRSYVYPKGIYAGVSADSELAWGVNATYVQKDFLVGYSYRPGYSFQPLVTNEFKPVHEVRAAINIFNLFK